MSIILWGQQIALYLIFIIIFSVIYLLTWGFTRHHFKHFTVYYQLMLGVFFAVLTAIAQGLIYYFDNRIDIYVIVIYLPIIVCWILGIFASFYAALSCGAMVFVFAFEMPKVLPDYFLPMNDKWLIGLMILLHLNSLSICFVGAKERWTNWTKWSLVSLISFIFSSLLVVVVNVKDLKIIDQLEYELNILIWISVAYFSYFLGWVIENIYKHAIKLQNIVVYDNNAFVREALSHSYLYQNISQHKIRHGFYLTYEIKDIGQIETHINSSVKDKIIDLIAMQVIFHFKNNKNIFFKASKNNFGIFIPIDNQQINLKLFKKNNLLKTRTTDDVLSEIEAKLKNIVTTFKLRNHQITVNLQSYVSLYGIQSNNLDKLKEMNMFLFKNKKQINFENALLFADEKIINEIREKNRNLLALDEILSLDRVASVYYPIIDVNNFAINAYYTTNIIDGSNVDIDHSNKLDLVEKYNISDILQRYNSALNIKNFRYLDTYLHERVFLNYPSSFISSTVFNTKRFIQKLIEFKIKPSNIVLVFDITKDIINKELLEANICQLKKYDLKIAVSNLGISDIKYELLAFYQPDYGIINSKIVQEVIMRLRNQELLKQLVILSNKVKMQLIAPYVNSYLIYKKMKSLNIPLIFGNLIASDEKPIKMLSNDILFLLNK